MLKKTKTNKKTIAIVVLAVLLVALLAFNVTYAYFTDKDSGSGTLNFGIVDFTLEDFGTTIAHTSNGTHLTTYVMPGDKVTLAGTITVSSAENADDIWFKVDVPADQIKIQYDGTDLVFDGTVTNATTGHQYQTGDEATMKNAVTTAVQTAIINAFKGLSEANAVWKLADNGISANKVTKGSSLNLNTISFTLDATQFGNLFQDTTILFGIEFQAIQATNVADNAAAETLWPTINFDTGLTA